ncbi:MAG: DegV family protein [bacterium]
MMSDRYQRALAAGAAAVHEWADLLNRINVYPVADGDTGDNLVASLAPLANATGNNASDPDDLRQRLLLAARGNSGNIAAQFFAGLLSKPSPEALSETVPLGRKWAWSAVHDPQPGTMLSLFDAFEESLLAADRTDDAWVAGVLERLEQAVRKTPEQLTALRAAGVVDAGALGMFIFLDRFLRGLAPVAAALPSVAQRFGPLLQMVRGLSLGPESGFCVDAVVRTGSTGRAQLEALQSLGESAVAIEHGGLVKIHLHTDDVPALKKALSDAGELVRFSADDLGAQATEFARVHRAGVLHVATDAAGSVHADDAAQLGITLLSSYVNCGGESTPESHLVAARLYEAMHRGERVSTSQASVAERHEHYARLLEEHDRVLYLCVGSAFTGNYEVVTEWKRTHDPQDRMVALDSGAASGKLGVIALATAEYARRAPDAAAVIAFAERAFDCADELIFLERLKYLAAGGRLSKTAAFFGDALRMKPIVTPARDGARKVGVVRNQRDQLAFARRRLASLTPAAGAYLVLLEHTDNATWVASEVASEVGRLLPDARILVRPVSLTSGAHMGPGTWAVAYLGFDADGLPVPGTPAESSGT